MWLLVQLNNVPFNTGYSHINGLHKVYGLVGKQGAFLFGSLFSQRFSFLDFGEVIKFD
jgi:hypothetical protein